jgi:hypothetical protein
VQEKPTAPHLPGDSPALTRDNVLALTRIGVSNAVIARQLASAAPAPATQNFTPAQPDGPATIGEVTVEGQASEERKQAAKEVTAAMDLLVKSYLLYKTNLSGAASLFQKLIETPSLKEAVFDVNNVVKKGWEKAWGKIIDGVVAAVGEEVPLAKETLEAGKLVIEELDRSVAALGALDRFKVVESWQRAASNRIDALAKKAGGGDAVYSVLTTKLDEDDKKALEQAKDVRAKAQAQFDATPSIDDVYQTLAIAYIGENYAQREDGWIFKDTVTTGKLFMTITLDESGSERSKFARIAVPGADRLADALFPAGAPVDVLQLPLRRQVTVEMKGQIDENHQERLADRTITYELDPGARALAGSKTSKVGIDAGTDSANVGAFNPAQIILRRGDATFVPEDTV